MKQLKVMRRKKNITQAQLGKILGVSQQAIAKWENGISKPRAEMLVMIADYFCCSVDELLRGEIENDKPFF